MSANTSFWERRPWLGAGIFAAVMVAMAWFLATHVGERPHFRATWTLRTEVQRGAVTGAHPEDLSDSIRLWVRVRVCDEKLVGLPGVEVVLLDPTDQTVFARGFSAPPEGHIFMPVPNRLSPVLFAGELPVMALIPGQPLRAITEKPNRGEATVVLEARNVRPIRVAVDASVSPLAGRLRAYESALGSDARSIGAEIVDHVAQLGAAAVDVPLTLELSVEGRETTTLSTAIPAGTGPHALSMEPGQELASVEVTVPTEGNIRVYLLGYRNGNPFLEAHRLRPHAGRLRIRTKAAEHLSLAMVDTTSKSSVRHSRELLAEKDVWTVPDSPLNSQPLILGGRLLDAAGQPASGVLLTLRPSAFSSAELPLPILGTAVTNKDGTFELHGDLPQSGAVLHGEAGEWVVTHPVSEAAKDLTLTLGAAHSIRWTLKDVPPPEARVILCVAGMLPLYSIRSVAATTSGAFEDLPPGRYELHLISEGQIVASSKASESRPRNDSDPKIIEL
jgi:hypothetical protein